MELARLDSQAVAYTASASSPWIYLSSTSTDAGRRWSRLPGRLLFRLKVLTCFLPIACDVRSASVTPWKLHALFNEMLFSY